MATKEGQPALRLAFSNGMRISASSNSTAHCLGRRRRRMKPHQQLKGDLGLQVFRSGPADPLPVFRRDPSTLTPLFDPPQRLVDSLGKVRSSAENDKNIGNVTDGFALHALLLPSDNESGQWRTEWAMTSQPLKRTMCPMGRATTPARFKKDFCRRVRSARILAGLTQGEAAEKLGVKEDTYSKYERRSPMQHYLIPKACELFEVKPEKLYGLAPAPELDRDYEEIRRAG